MYHRRDYGNYNTNTYYTIRIIIANVIVFFGLLLIANILPTDATTFIQEQFMVSYDSVFKEFRIWTLLTAAFAHGGFGHIFWNMIIFFFVGPIAENVLGGKRFLKFYLCSAAFASFAYAVASPNIPAVGASGALMATLVLAACRRPKLKFYLFGLVPMTLFIMMLIFLAMDLSRVLSHNAGGVAVAGHLGGALFGYLWHKFDRPKVYSPNTYSEDDRYDFEL
jgi:membrane associated rhomboid family serine protease